MKSMLGYAKALENHKPYIVMVYIQFGFAGNALLSKTAIAKGMHPSVYVAYRQAFAAIFLAMLALVFERKKATPLSFNVFCKIFIGSLCGLCVGLNLYAAAFKHTSATFAAATSNTVPAFTFIMALLLRMESISLKQCHGIAKVVGSVMGFCGALVFAVVKGPVIVNWHRPVHGEIPHPSPGSSSPKWELVKGPAVMLSGSMLWTLWLMLQVPVMKQYPAKLWFTTLQCFFSCIQSTVWAFATERDLSSWRLKWDLNLLSVAYCGVIVTGINYWLQVWVVDKKGPVFRAIFTPLSLLITATYSTLVWKENLSLGSIGGTILLVGGLYVVLWGKIGEAQEKETKEKKRQEPSAETKLEECITHHDSSKDDGVTLQPQETVIGER